MKPAANLFTGVVQKPISIRHWSSFSPLLYRDLSMMQGIFLADLDAARALLPSTRLRPVVGLPGKAVVAVNCFQYKDTDVGPYNEVGVSVAVQVDGGLPGPLALARSKLTRSYHGHVLELPVNTEIALAGGLDYFNYPKFLADISFREDGDLRICRVTERDTGEMIFNLRGKLIRTRRRKPDKGPVPVHYFSYPVKDGGLLRARLVLDALEQGYSFLGSGLQIEIGEHPRAACLRKLRLGRLVEYVYAPRCQAILYEPGPV